MLRCGVQSVALVFDGEDNDHADGNNADDHCNGNLGFVILGQLFATDLGRRSFSYKVNGKIYISVEEYSVSNDLYLSSRVSTIQWFLPAAGCVHGVLARHHHQHQESSPAAHISHRRAHHHAVARGGAHTRRPRAAPRTMYPAERWA